ncbi:hypothetical protein Tco_1140023 [Tanacetum coccineum]
MQHNELMDLVTKLSDRVVALETDLTQTKKVYGAAFTKLIKKVKKLEKKDKLSKSRRKLRLVLLDEEGSDSILPLLNKFGEREYPLSRSVLTQMLVAKLLVEQDNEMSRELLRKIFMQIERPRR